MKSIRSTYASHASYRFGLANNKLPIYYYISLTINSTHNITNPTMYSFGGMTLIFYSALSLDGSPPVRPLKFSRLS